MACVIFNRTENTGMVRLSRSDGMSHECAVNCDHLQTVARSRIVALITQLGPTRIEEIRRAIAFALDL